MISLSNIQVSFGGRAILKGVDLAIPDGERLAVVGPNGCGKSTLLRIIAGIEPADAGGVHMPPQTTIGYLPQEAELEDDRSLEEELLSAFSELQSALEEMAELEHDMTRLESDSPAYEKIMSRYADLSHQVERQEGYALEPQVRRVAAGLGFAQEDLARSCTEFSGGWKMRILLGKVLLRNPDILLLDEPTNHLDLETMLWLEQWIRNCRRTVIMVSHERSFMDRLVNRIVCLGSGTAEVYTGGYTEYLRQSKERREALWIAYERQKEEIEKVEAFIRKFRYNAARASQVQSRVKQLDKIERLEPPFHPTAIHFRFPAAPDSYREVLKLENLGHSYGDHQVFSGIDLIISRGEKIGLVGMNGAGKSTLLRILSGREAPTRGRCTLGGKVSMSYFAQYDTETLSSRQSLLSALESTAPTGDAGRARDVLGAFLFSGDDAEKPLQVLSGGERTRFRLAQMLFSPANLLVLDEPTNHLDITSRATVEEALRSYTGTVIVVSHDPVFMNRVTDRILELEGGHLRTYPGCYDDYLRYKEKLAASEETGSSDQPPLEIPVRDPSPPREATVYPVYDLSPKEQRRMEREAQKAKERKIRQIERAIDDAETNIQAHEHRVDELNLLMADPQVAADFSRLGPLADERKTLVGKLQESMAQWEQLHAELEQGNSQ